MYKGIDNNYKSQKILDYLLVFIILCHILFIYPSVLPFFLPIPSVTILTGVFIIIYSTIILFLRCISLPCKFLNQCFLIQLITWIILSFLNKDPVYITRSVFLINSFLVMICMWNTKDSFRLFDEGYVKLITILGIGGVIAFILVLFGYLNPILTYENIDGREGFFYGFSCTNAKLGNLIRYSGIFDEPGAMAFWGIFALIINRFTINKQYFETIIIICLVFTFSMAYYIQIFLYFVCFKVHKVKSFLKLFLFITILISAVGLTKDSEFDLYTPTVLRFEMGDDGELNGDNRSSSAKVAKKHFIDSPLIGKGPNITTTGEYLADNPFENLATDGIIGTIVMYLPLLLLLFPFNKEVSKAIIIIMLGYLQRPFHQNFMHAFMLYYISYTLYQYKKNYIE